LDVEDTAIVSLQFDGKGRAPTAHVFDLGVASAAESGNHRGEVSNLSIEDSSLCPLMAGPGGGDFSSFRTVQRFIADWFEFVAEEFYMN
jgi:hypothetical protein